MKACSSCGGENRTDALFCTSCGRSLGLTCLSCETNLPDGARFCYACGEPVQEESAQPLKIRRTVTVVFNDLVGSTPLGERLDPETLRALIERYLEDITRIVESYGGEVMQFRGDGVMAVFGAPVAHEDDAFRAVRTALDISEVMRAQGDGGIEARTGINTGEILWTEEGGHPIVVGDAINVGARLQESAAPGEIVLGDATFRLVKDRVRADPVMDLTLKGKKEVVTAWRFVELIETATERRHPGTPFIGRERELDLLQHSYERSCAESVCQMVTVLGEAGVGKSRLVAEWRARLTPEPRFVSGRCLSYGDGITFWPVVELISALAEIGPQDAPHIARSKIESLFGDEKGATGASDTIAQVLGLAPTTVATEQIFWAVARTFKDAARRRPLVVLIEDLHWAGPTFLDLIEHLASWIIDAPIFLLCTSREELLESRPTWGGGGTDTLTINLRSLATAQAQRLLEGLLGSDPSHEDLRQRVTEAAGGNPLFIEETAAMLLDGAALGEAKEAANGSGGLKELQIPLSLQGLLAARLDTLTPEERRTIGVAAVMGSAFSGQGVTTLSQGGGEKALPLLVRRGLVVLGTEEFRGEPTYRFRHILIRDAAYEALAKETRADLHQRYAGWLKSVLGDRTKEYEEIIGFHLERAHHLATELGAADPGLALQAFERLSAAGGRAHTRYDDEAAVALLRRALALVPFDHPGAPQATLRLVDSLIDQGSWPEAIELLESVEGTARQQDDSAISGAAKLRRAQLAAVHHIKTGPHLSERQALDLIEEAIRDLEDCEEGARYRGWQLRGWIYFGWGQLAEAFDSYERALLGAIECGDLRTESEARRGMLGALIYGPVPTSEMLRLAESHLDWAKEKHDRVTEARVTATMAMANAMRGEFDAARELMGTTQEVLKDVGTKLRLSWNALEVALVELLAGRAEIAEQVLRPAYAYLGSINEKAVRASMADALAEALIIQGRFDEAEAYAAASENTADEKDIFCQSAWRRNRARISAARGDLDEAGRLLEDSLSLVEGTDLLSDWGQILVAVAEVASARGDPNNARATLDRACELFTTKENLVEAERVAELTQALEL